MTNLALAQFDSEMKKQQDRAEHLRVLLDLWQQEYAEIDAEIESPEGREFVKNGLKYASIGPVNNFKLGGER